MTEQIEKALIAAIGDIAPVFLDEAEIGEYPFATYDIVVTPHYTKDGVHKLVADVRLYCIADNFGEAHTVSEEIKEAVLTTMSGGQFRAREVNETPKCYEGIWDVETNYQITQFYEVAEEPTSVQEPIEQN